MPKLKTHKGSCKRFKVTAGGKVMRHKGGSGHLMSGKRPKRCRHMRKALPMSPAWARKEKILLGA